jgi:hypothetical protein
MTSELLNLANSDTDKVSEELISKALDNGKSEKDIDRALDEVQK